MPPAGWMPAMGRDAATARFKLSCIATICKNPATRAGRQVETLSVTEPTIMRTGMPPFRVAKLSRRSNPV